MNKMKNVFIENDIITIIPTLQCNQHCILCPQEVNDSAASIDNLVTILTAQNWSDISSCYLTGGEPLTDQTIVATILDYIPKDKQIFILTNGTLQVANKIMEDQRIKYCIPLYSANSSIHDYLVQRKSFTDVLTNLYTLGSEKCHIEIRTVLTKYNYKELFEFSHFVSMNLPFVDNVAFMGMELVERAFINKEDVFLDPFRFVPELMESVEYLNACKIASYIYNFPICYFPDSFRTYVKPTISPWKQYFLESCYNCDKKSICSGIFISNKEIQSIGGIK
jgi:His-Xaa-Ser system radical SAM maturase HxsC